MKTPANFSKNQTEVAAIGKKLSVARKVIWSANKELVKLLERTGHSDANLKIDQENIEPAVHGADAIEILSAPTKAFHQNR